jgi:hydroxyacylglutathione hydrolase
MPTLAKIINLGGVNCYLLSAKEGYVLVDTGFIGRRKRLEESLAAAGCMVGKLKLIILTHGDSDHADNCVFLRDMFSCPIAMHSLDAEMVEFGEMNRGRKAKPDRYSPLFRLIGRLFGSLARANAFEKFKPDILVDEAFDLRAYGLQARILHTPGHSKGSISVLTDEGDLFCGDFAYNLPGFQFIDDMAEHAQSLSKLRKEHIKTVYPGHGKPFPMSELIKKG